MSFHALFRLAAVVGVGAAACSEPVDCSAAPGRCVAVPSAAVAVEPAAPEPAVRSLFRRPVEVAVGPVRKDLQMRMDPSIAVPQGARIRPSLYGAPVPAGVTAEAPTASASEDDAALKLAIQALLPSIKAHDAAALKPLMTDRLRLSLEQGVLDKQASRFWRHLDRYVTVLAADLVLTSERGDSADARQVRIRVVDGNELKPVLVRSGSGWKVDRF